LVHRVEKLKQKGALTRACQGIYSANSNIISKSKEVEEYLEAHKVPKSEWTGLLGYKKTPLQLGALLEAAGAKPPEEALLVAKKEADKEGVHGFKSELCCKCQDFCSHK
jgi:hypothetical protein